MRFTRTILGINIEGIREKRFIPFMMILFFGHRYDMEAIYFDEGVRSSKRQQLESKLLQVRSYF
jgi:hypothetical protein